MKQTYSDRHWKKATLKTLKRKQFSKATQTLRKTWIFTIIRVLKASAHPDIVENGDILVFQKKLTNVFKLIPYFLELSLKTKRKRFLLKHRNTLCTSCFSRFSRYILKSLNKYRVYSKKNNVYVLNFKPFKHILHPSFSED